MTGLFKDIILRNVSLRKKCCFKGSALNKNYQNLYSFVFELEKIILKTIKKYEQEEHLIKGNYV